MTHAARFLRLLVVAHLGAAASVLGCSAPASTPAPRGDRADTPIDTPAKGAPEVAVEPRPVFAIGDLHGDLVSATKALELTGLVKDERWIGGDAILVQTGDQLDRGDDEPEILALLQSLTEQAAAAGGEVHVLNGNHEIMNASGDMRYVTEDGFHDFDRADKTKEIEGVPEHAQGRLLSFRPGGEMATLLATRDVAVVLERTAFVHGGLLPQYARELETINRETRAWLAGERPTPPAAVLEPDGPVWSRHYSDNPDGADCKLLEEALQILDADRMVVGHTVQKQVRSACDGKVWMVDVGMAAHYGGKPAALEIRGDLVTVLSQ